MRVGTKISKLILTLAFAGILLGCEGNTTSDNKSPGGDGKKNLKAKLENEPPQNAQSKKSTIPATLQEAIGGFRFQIESEEERLQISFNQNADAWAGAGWNGGDQQLWKIVAQGKVKIDGLQVFLIFDDGKKSLMKFASRNPQKGDKMELGKVRNGEEKWSPANLVDITKHSATSLTESFSKQTDADKKKADAHRKERNNNHNAVKLLNGLHKYQRRNGLKLPVADRWCDAVLREVDELGFFLSPQHPHTERLKAALPKGKRVSHYAFNKVMSGKDNPNYRNSRNDIEVVLVFECDLGWNGAGGLEDALKYMDKFKLEKIAVATPAGAARAVTREELKKLKWEITP